MQCHSLHYFIDESVKDLLNRGKPPPPPPYTQKKCLVFGNPISVGPTPIFWDI